MSQITISRDSLLLAECRFYDDTFLIGDSGPVLFILDAALVRGPSGKERMRTKRDVIDFPDEAAMLAAIKDGDWQVAPLDDDPRWKPSPALLRSSWRGTPMTLDPGDEEE